MAVEISSGALSLVQKALSLAGAKQGVVSLQDGDVQQVLDINQLVAAAVPATRDRGLFGIRFSQGHGGAGTLTDLVNPFAATTFLNGLTDAQLNAFDLWMLGASCTTSVSTGVTAAMLTLTTANPFQAVTDATTSLPSFPLATWDEQFDFDTTDLMSGPDGTFVKLGLRIPRSTSGIRATSVATGAVTVFQSILCEMVPVGLKPSTML